MIDITPAIPANLNIITAYGDGGFRINRKRLEGHLIVGLRSFETWSDPDLNSQGIESLIQNIRLLKDPAEIVLLGTGKNIQLIDNSPGKQFFSAGFHFDSMDTGAACRTFNVLVSEGRHVVAALMAV